MPTAARFTLPDEPDLDHLRGQARRLRDGVAARDPRALDLLATYDPPVAETIALTRAQRVIARAYGFAGWSRLRHHLETIQRLTRPMETERPDDGPEDRFLRTACLNYAGRPDPAAARALLDADAGLATASVATLAACGRADALAAVLGDDPAAATRDTGPYGWPPLLYACYSRAPMADAVGTVRVLLAAGADPNSGFLWRGLVSAFTALTGAFGGGERGEPPHPDGVAIAELLLDAGADPNDNQTFYNRMFRPDDSHLPPLLAHGAGHDRPSPWRDRFGDVYPTPEQMLGEHLRSAAADGFIERVRTLLAHGVDPETRGYHPIHGDASPYELAVRRGHRACADLLADAGAVTGGVDEADRLLGAVLAGDRPTVDAAPPDLRDRLLREHPDLLRAAAEHHGRPAVALVLDLGVDVDARGPSGQTALHQAAWDGDAELCRFLLTRGADPTLTDASHGGTPAGWAEFAGHAELAAELAPER